METIFNGDLKSKLSADIGATNPAKMPPAITDYVVPMILVNDPVYYAKESFSETATASNSTSATIFTSDAVKDTYLNSVSLTLIKDATATSLSSTITAVINGATKTLAIIPSFTLTAQTLAISVTFNVPIKIDRSTAVNVTNSTNVGNVKASGCVSGFLRVRN